MALQTLFFGRLIDVVVLVEQHTTTIMAQYDLTKTIIPYLDRHLAFPLLAHLSETELFPVDQVRAAQYELAKGTNMVDYSVSLFEQLHPDQPVPQGGTYLTIPCISHFGS